MRSDVSNNSRDALSPVARVLMWTTSVLFLLLGAVLFLAPGWASPNFVWKVSPFVAMSMGGWYLGNGFMAWEVARIWKWGDVYASMLLLWIFSFLEAAVLIIFSDKLIPGATLGWPYIAILTMATITAIVCIVDWVRTRPSTASSAGGVSSGLLVLLIAFVLIVAVIGVVPLLGYGTSGTIFPEPISPFTLRAFGCFYLSLALATIPLIVTRSLRATLFYARTGLVLVSLITVAALVNLDKFDFDVHPGKWAYLGTYIVVGVAVAILVFRHSAQTWRADAPSQA
jgi:hypothetical protein